MTDKLRKVAILGTAPSSLSAAPVNDPSWEIWATGPAIFGKLPRVDRWFEIHTPGDEESKRYFDALNEYDGEVWSFTDLKLKNLIKYPRAEIIEAYGEWFLSSSIAWMEALAIKEKVDVMGLFGVEMAEDTEYADQKPGCLHFIEKAIGLGIQVVVPECSELLSVKPPYPAGESVAARKVAARIKLLEKGLAEAKAEIDKFRMMEANIMGALSEIRKLQRHIV